MTTSFTPAADPAATPEVAEPQGSNFSNANNGDPIVPAVPEVATPAMSPTDLAALQTRDTHAQAHIATLEAEAASRKQEMLDMQGKLDQASTVEDVLRAKESATVDVDDIATKVAQTIKSQADAENLETLKTNNFATVSEALTEKFGMVDVDKNVQAICAENDMTWDDMVDLARKNPKLAMKLCDVEVKTVAQPTTPTINYNAFMAQNQNTLEQPTKVNVMDLRTDKDRVADFQRRMDEFTQS